MSKFPVVVMTSDNYLEALRPFAWLFQKYWGPDQHVIVVGFEAPDFELPDNFTFFSLGNMDAYPVGKWSNALLDFMDHFPLEDVFVLMLEDYWLTRPVHVREVHMLADYMRQFRYVIKMDLFTDRRYAGGVSAYGACGHVPLVKSDPGSQYHFSLMCGLWNREALSKVLRPNWSPWEVELAGTPELAKYGDRYVVLGTDSWTDDPRECPVHHTLAHRRGDPSQLLLDDLKEEDLCQMRELGLLPAV